MDGDDAELFAQWRAGDARAGRMLYRRHAPAVLRFFRTKLPDSAEDLTQEAFARFLHEPAEPAYLRGYLFGIARNLLREHLRRIAPTFDPTSTSIADLALPSTTQIIARRSLLSALLVLPLDLQLVIELHYWEGLTSEELGAALGISASAARSRLSVARERLRVSLSKQFPKRPKTDFDDIDTWAAQLREASER